MFCLALRTSVGAPPCLQLPSITCGMLSKCQEFRGSTRNSAAPCRMQGRRATQAHGCSKRPQISSALLAWCMYLPGVPMRSPSHMHAEAMHARALPILIHRGGGDAVKGKSAVDGGAAMALELATDLAPALLDFARGRI